MSSTRLVRPLRRLVALAAILIVAGLVGRDTRLGAQAAALKLTTVLADITTVVRQDDPSTLPAAFPAAVDATTLPKSAQDAIRSRDLRIDATGSVQVYVLLNDVSAGAMEALTQAGAAIQIPDAPNNRVQAAIPLARLMAVASLKVVNFIRLPNYAIRRRTGSVTSEGDAIIHADAARAAFGIDGTGVKVGVISDGLKGVFATGCTTCAGVANGPIATGDLPSASGTRSSSGTLTASSGGIVGETFTSDKDLEGLQPGCAFAGAGAEGTALLEIVHDIAPGASLAFANADTDMAFNQAVNALATGNDVVVDDLGFFIPPFDGTNTVSANTSAALNNNANRIRAYVTANGNDADEHYYGSYVDSGVDGPTFKGINNAGHVHLFQSSSTTTDVLALGSHPNNVISLPNSGSVDVFLVWDDPAGHSTNNYDLFLVNQSTNTVVASSTDVQAGNADPLESLRYTNTGPDGTFLIVVQNVGNAAAAKHLNIISFQEECDAKGPLLLAPGHHERLNYNTASESVASESDAGGTPVSVISVGAICSGTPAAAAAAGPAGAPPDESCTDPTHSTIEFYSSQGPTLDGRVKPDISAIDGVSITGAGSFEVPFFGTSAAAPHVAGEAALLLQAVGCLSSTSTFGLDAATARGKLRSLIVSNADARSSAPPDNVFGAGLADVLKAVQASVPTYGGAANLIVSGNVVNGARLTGSQLGFTDPDGCPIARLSWTGGCGSSPDSAMTCPLGTTNVSVAASNSGTAFSADSPLAVTVTGFTVAASPSTATVTAGQAAHYSLTVTPQSGPFSNPITLGCGGLPQGASCTFSPATVTPGPSAVLVALTVSTTASASALALPLPVGPPSVTRPALLAPRQATVPVTAVLFMVLASVVGWRLGRLPSPRRRALSLAAWGATVAAFALQIACGNNNNSASTSTTVSFTPSSLSFASQSTGTSAPPQAITLTNTGTSTLTISGITASGDFSSTNSCNGALAAGASCAVTVVFAPTSAGSRSGTLTITDNATNSPQRINLSGTGVSSTGATPAGTFQVMVNGASGTLVISGAITLTVQ